MTNPTTPKILTLPAHKLTLSDDVQPRAEIDDATVERYAEDMAGGAIFPPVIAFGDGERLWLADGFHRVKAACKDAGGTAKDAAVEVEIHDGDKREAILYAIKANRIHGKPRTNADKRRCVEMLLKDQAWVTWSNVKIAAEACVSETLVGRVRDELSAPKAQTTKTPAKPESRTVVRKSKKGKETTYEQKVKPRKTPPEPDAPPVDDLGNTITDPKVIQVFAEKDQITGLVNELRAAKRKVGKLKDQDVAEFVDVQRVQVDIENAVRALKFSLPFCITPAVLAEQNPDMGRIGWMPKVHHDNLPPEHQHGYEAKNVAEEPF